MHSAMLAGVMRRHFRMWTITSRTGSLGAALCAGQGRKCGTRVNMVPELWSFLAKGAQDQRPRRRILDVLDQHHAPNAWDTDSPSS